MRFVLLLAGATATGALSAGAIQTIFPQTQQTFQAMLALGGDLKNFKISDINPVKAYQDVMRQITSGDLGGPLSFPTSPTFKSGPINLDALRPTFKIDDRDIQRAISAGINSRVQQDIRRAQDFSAYGRNPTRWHGAPPH